MKKIVKVTALTLAMSFSFLGTNLVSPANVSYASEQVARFDYPANQPNAPYQEHVVKLSANDATRKEVLDGFRNIRAKAVEDNLKIYDEQIGSYRSLDQFIENYYYNKDSYINKISYSYELEKLAIQRAYELTLTGNDQNRPGGYSVDTLYRTFKSGDGDYRQYLAAGPHIWWVEDYDFTIADNFSELGEGPDSYYEKLKKAGGVDDNNLASYILIDSPTFLSVGYAKVHNVETGKTAALFAIGYDPVAGEKVDYVGDYKLSYGRKNYKALDKKSEDGLRKSLNAAKLQVDSVTYLMINYPETISNVSGKLYELREKAERLIDQAYNYIPVE